MVAEQLIGVCFSMSNIYIMQPVNISNILGTEFSKLSVKYFQLN